MAQGFKAGLIGGLSATQVAGDQLSGFDKLGVVGGGFVYTPVSEKSSVQMEIIYIQKGSRKPLVAATNEYYLMRLSYIEVPLVFRYNAYPRFIVEAGASAGVLVFSEEEDQNGTQNHRPPFHEFDYCLNFGLNYSLNKTWSLNARFSNSFVPMRDFETGFSFMNFENGQYNTVVAVTMHYQF